MRHESACRPALALRFSDRTGVRNGTFDCAGRIVLNDDKNVDHESQQVVAMG